MKDINEQLSTIMERSDIIIKKRELRSKMLKCSISAVTCIVLLCITVVKMKDLVNTTINGVGDYYGSLIISTSSMGYVVIGILAFILGIFTTLVCYYASRLRKLK